MRRRLDIRQRSPGGGSHHRPLLSHPVPRQEGASAEVPVGRHGDDQVCRRDGDRRGPRQNDRPQTVRHQCLYETHGLHASDQFPARDGTTG